MNRMELKEIILEQNKTKTSENLIRRDVFDKVEDYVKTSFIIIINGIRRSGKSTLLSQIREKYDGYYLNFDDERFVKFTLEDFQAMYEIFIELYGKKDFFYFDEIQNIKGWERFVRRLHDEKKKVFVTGSNASMLSRELGTHLTGRHLDITLFPFSFNEFLELKGLETSRFAFAQSPRFSSKVSKSNLDGAQEPEHAPEFIQRVLDIEKDSIYLIEKKSNIKRLFEDYFIKGGFAEYLKTENKEYLKMLYDNILYRDIITRYNLSNESALKGLVYFISSNVAKEISFNSIKKLLNLGSSTTVKDYFDYLENSFLAFIIPKFDYSLKKQIYANKKMYLIDNALAINLGFRISEDLGRLLENMVFIELKRRRKEIFYFQEKNECDFVIREGIKIVEAIQVCYDFNEENREREINGLLEALRKFKLKEGLILTYDQEDEMKLENKKINIIPVWKWLLDM